MKSIRESLKKIFEGNVSHDITGASGTVFHIEIEIDSDDASLFQVVLNGTRYIMPKRAKKSVDSALEWAKTKLIPTREGLKSQKVLTGGDMSAAITDQYFRDVKKRGF